MAGTRRTSLVISSKVSDSSIVSSTPNSSRICIYFSPQPTLHWIFSYTQPLPMPTELPFPENTGNLFHSVPLHMWILGSYNYCLPWTPLSPLCYTTVITVLMKSYLAPGKVHHHLLFITSAQTNTVTITVEYWDKLFFKINYIQRQGKEAIYPNFHQTLFKKLVERQRDTQIELHNTWSPARLKPRT